MAKARDTGKLNKKKVENPIGVQKHLKGMDYPAAREKILEHAREQKAPEDILSMLSKLPPREYRNAADVMKGMGGSR